MNWKQAKEELLKDPATSYLWFRPNGASDSTVTNMTYYDWFADGWDKLGGGRG